MTKEETKKAAIRVLGTQGRAPVVARGMSDQTLAKLAAMLGPEGNLVEDVREQVRLVLVEHAESQKATHADDDAPTVDVAAQQKVRDDAAARLDTVKGEIRKLAEQAARGATQATAQKDLEEKPLE